MQTGGKLSVDSTCTIVNDTIVCQAVKPTNVFTPRLTAQLLGLYEPYGTIYQSFEQRELLVLGSLHLLLRRSRCVIPSRAIKFLVEFEKKRRLKNHSLPQQYSCVVE